MPSLEAIRAAAGNVIKQGHERFARGEKPPVPALSLSWVPTAKQFNLF